MLAWLTRTAVREAVRLIRRDRRDLSFEDAVEVSEEQMCRVRIPGPEEVVLSRERLQWIRGLPERQQRLLWLRALGLSYAEMALQTGCTERTVERELFRAAQALRTRAAA